MFEQSTIEDFWDWITRSTRVRLSDDIYSELFKDDMRINIMVELRDHIREGTSQRAAVNLMIMNHFEILIKEKFSKFDFKIRWREGGSYLVFKNKDDALLFQLLYS